MDPTKRALFAVVFCVAGALPARAALRSGEEVVIPAGEVIPEDLYVTGGEVTVDGEVQGDLIVAGGEVTVRGKVTGDVLAAGGEVDLKGEVGGSIRAMGGEVTVESQVAEDVVAMAGELDLESSGSVGRDVLALGGEVSLGARVGRAVRAAGGNLSLNAPVGGDVHVQAGDLTLGEQAKVAGDLTYRSSDEAEIASGAVMGKVEAQEAKRRRSPVVSLLLRFLRLLVGLFVLAVLVRLLFPKLTAEAQDSVRARPLSSLGLGLLAVLGTPVVAVLVIGLGALVGGWWLGLIVLALFAALVALGFAVVGLFAGDWLARRVLKSSSPWLSALAGALVLAVTLVIPFLGGLVWLVVLFFGTGAALGTAWRRRGHPAQPEGSAVGA